MVLAVYWIIAVKPPILMSHKMTNEDYPSVFRSVNITVTQGTTVLPDTVLKMNMKRK